MADHFPRMGAEVRSNWKAGMTEEQGLQEGNRGTTNDADPSADADQVVAQWRIGVAKFLVIFIFM